MNEPLTEFEERLVSALREHVARPDLRASPASVVADVTGRRVGPFAGTRRWLAAGVVASLVLIAAGAALLGPRLLELGQGSYPIAVSVNGRDYLVGVGRGLILDPADLVPFGQIEPASDHRLPVASFVGATAYRLPGVDPSEALVTPSGGAYEPEDIPYAVLHGGPPASGPTGAWCAYWEPDARFDSCPSHAGIVRLFPSEPLPVPYDWAGVATALAPRGFELKPPTPAEVQRLGVDGSQVVADFEAALASDPAARLVSVHLAAVGLAIERLGLERDRELMYVAETTGHRTGNCIVLWPATESDVPRVEACFYSERSAPAAEPAGPIDGSALTKHPLWERSYELDGLTVLLHATAIADLGRPGFSNWRLLDGETVILNYRAGDALPVPPSDAGPLSGWLADLRAQMLTGIDVEGPIHDVDASGQRILLWAPNALRMIDRSGEEVARYATSSPWGVFLSDGSVVVYANNALRVWHPGVGIQSLFPIPPDVGRHRMAAVGDRLALFVLSSSGPPTSALFDPLTWERVGPDWPSTDGYELAVSPDGTRFVVAVGRDGDGDALHIRDVATGEVLAVNDLPRATSFEGLAWPTDDVIVAIRSAAEPDGAPKPELYLAGAFDGEPLQIEPFTDNYRPWTFSARGNRLLVADSSGDLVVVSVAQTGRVPTPAPTPQPTAGATPAPAVEQIEVESLFERSYEVGETLVTLAGTQLRPTGSAVLRSWIPIDGATLVVGSAPTSGAAMDAAWLADLRAGTLEQIARGQVFIVDARRDRVLIGNAAGLRVLDLQATVLATLAEPRAVGVFLADGTVAAGSDRGLGVWDPVGEGVTWFPHPGQSDRYSLAAVGVSVALIGWLSEQSTLLDPRSGTQLGEPWPMDQAYLPATSPDGSRFVVAVATGEPRGVIELRDAATGEVLAINDGRPLSHVTHLSWLTDDVILVMRASTGTDVVAQPELLHVGAFEQRALPIDPFVDRPAAITSRGNIVVIESEAGEIVLVEAAQETR